MAFDPNEPRDYHGRWVEDSTSALQKAASDKPVKDFKTGQAVTINFLHNPVKSENFGTEFGQHVEPAGKFITQSHGYVPPGWQSGTITLKSPLVIEVTDATQISYKYELSKKYGGKTGVALSKAIAKDGYDSIVTKFPEGDSNEIIILKK